MSKITVATRPDAPRTLPREERPRAKNLAALRGLRIGPLFPRDAEAPLFSGMRGAPPRRKTLPPIDNAYRVWRRVRRHIADASRRANRR